MAQPQSGGLTSRLFTLTCIAALLVFEPCVVRAQTPAASVEGEGSGVQFTAAPDTIVPGQTELLNLRCALGEGANINGQVSAIEVRRGGNVLASVTTEEDAKASTDDDQLTVEGSLDGNGYLSLTWREPVRALARKYRCVIIIQKDNGKREKLSEITSVRNRKPSRPDDCENVKQCLQDELSGLKKEIDSLRGEVHRKDNEIVSTIEELGQRTNSAIQALNLTQQGVRGDLHTLREEADRKDYEFLSEIEALKEQTDSAIQTQMISLQEATNNIKELREEIDRQETAISSRIDELSQQINAVNQGGKNLIQQGNHRCCGDNWINFPRPYDRPPAVFVGYRALDFASNKNLRVQLYVLEVQNNRFKVHCHKWSDTIMYPSTQFHWMSINQ